MGEGESQKRANTNKTNEVLAWSGKREGIKILVSPKLFKKIENELPKMHLGEI